MKINRHVVMNLFHDKWKTKNYKRDIRTSTSCSSPKEITRLSRSSSNPSARTLLRVGDVTDFPSMREKMNPLWSFPWHVVIGEISFFRDPASRRILYILHVSRAFLFCETYIKTLSALLTNCWSFVQQLLRLLLTRDKELCQSILLLFVIGFSSSSGKKKRRADEYGWSSAQ